MVSINIFILLNYDVWLKDFFQKKPKEIKEEMPIYEKVFIGNTSEYPIVEIYAPAVDNNGKGVLTKFRVQALPGSGRILVNINNLVYWTDTQNSIKIAKKVAEKFLKVNLSNIDLIYEIDANTTVVGGPSGGAALTLATIAAIKNITLRKDITITGTIEEDGSIGPVGGIEEKMEAAKEGGLKYFLVPIGEGKKVNYIPIKTCEKFEFIEFCRIEYKKEVEKIDKEFGINVIEVGNIEEAWKYFTNY